jgi:isoleucyl-tRNA synthetase
LLKERENQLPAIFIVSQVELLESEKDVIEIMVEHASGTKCERCWNWSETVGQDPRFPTIDARCVRQIEEGWGL